MYRRELNYWDLQQRGIGDVERYPVSEALASIEGQQLLGSAFDELAKRQQEFIAAEQRGIALRKLSAQTHMPINHLHHIDKTDRTVLGLEAPPPAAPAASSSHVSRAYASDTPARLSTEVASTGLEEAPIRRNERRTASSVEGSLIRSGVGSARTAASEAMSLDMEDNLTAGSVRSSTASSHRAAVRSLQPKESELPLASFNGNRVLSAAPVSYTHLTLPTNREV